MQFSFSAFNTYQTCPKQFFYAYVRKFPRVYKEQKKMNFGKAIHENIHTRFIGFDELEDICKRNCIQEEEKDLVELYTQKAFKILDSYPNYAIQTEYKFGLDKKLENYLPFEDAYFRGYIDAFMLGQEDCIILDWKTGVNKGNKKQLEFYAYVLNRIFKAKKFKACFVYLQNMKVEWFDITETKIDEIGKEMKETFKKLSTVKDYPYKPGFLCDWCGFQHFCNPNEESQNIISLDKIKELGINL